MSEHNSTKNFITGLIFGGLVGAAAAMLYAPQSGDDTRSMIRNTAMDAQVRAKDGIRSAQTQIGSKVSDIQSRAGEVVNTVSEDARRRTDRLKEIGREMVQEQRQVVEHEKEVLARGAADAQDALQS